MVSRIAPKRARNCESPTRAGASFTRPTSAHLPLPWIMGYDLEPLRTLESKRALLRDAAAGNWLLVFEHDPAVATGRLDETAKTPTLVDVTPAAGAGAR